MPESSLKYARTEAEMENQELSWQRPDKAFFAAGACHILAFEAKKLLNDPALEIIFVKPASEFGSTGTHVYLSDGTRAFDFNGWSQETDLLRVLETDYMKKYPNWTYERTVITSDLEDFCIKNNHAAPEVFAGNVARRAQDYFTTLESSILP